MGRSAPTLLYGDLIAQQMYHDLKAEVDLFQRAQKRAPHLAVVLSHTTAPSTLYVSKKVAACAFVGIRSTTITTACSTESELLSIIHELNQDPDIDGILVQFPLHPHISPHAITEAIDPLKDVDGLSPHNLGKLVQGRTDGLIPCTPKGIVKLLQYYDIATRGKDVAIIGRSTIVGRPLALLLSNNSPLGNATVHMTHSQTPNLAEITKRADIVVVAAGKKNLLTADMVKQGSIIIDVGINRFSDQSSKLVGDVDFENVRHLASAITPVPRGIGPMTVACLIENTLLSAKLRAEQQTRPLKSF